MFLLFDAHKKNIHSTHLYVLRQTEKKKKKTQTSKLLHGAPALMDRDANFNPDSTARFSQHKSVRFIGEWVGGLSEIGLFFFFFLIL